MTTTTDRYQDLAIFRTGRSLELDALAREQVILNGENETDRSEEDAATVNRESSFNRGERNFFKNQYRRHVRNIEAANPFYQ